RTLPDDQRQRRQSLPAENHLTPTSGTPEKAAPRRTAMNRRTAMTHMTAGIAAAACRPLQLAQAADAKDGVLRLSLRSRVQPFKGVDAWEEVTLRKELPARETALLICDMWDDHWCKPAAKRCDALAKKMAPVIAAARAKGVHIIHSPSDCMEF